MLTPESDVGDSAIVDFKVNTYQVDQEYETNLDQAVKIGLSVYLGDDDWVNNKIFIYDPNCTDKYNVRKYGGLRDGDAVLY